MTPGPTIIRECSQCGKLMTEHTIGSGNTFGARFWTDGFRDAPMLPDKPWLVKCPHCDFPVWIDEQKQVGEISPWSSAVRDGTAFADARPTITPALQDYEAFLETATVDQEKEQYVRLRAWWAGNDQRRELGRTKPLGDFESRNLHALVRLLGDADDGLGPIGGAMSKAALYPEEFKIEAVKQITERGHRVADVSARIGVSQHSLYKWIKRYQCPGVSGSSSR
jgi:hypothetical protein